MAMKRQQTLAKSWTSASASAAASAGDAGRGASLEEDTGVVERRDGRTFAFATCIASCGAQEDKLVRTSKPNAVPRWRPTAFKDTDKDRIGEIIGVALADGELWKWMQCSMPMYRSRPGTLLPVCHKESSQMLKLFQCACSSKSSTS